MTNATSNTRPVVKTSNPDLYAEHTFHMKRATEYTYNYAPLDDYILANWKTKTHRQIADDMNEYFNRVVYRVSVLKTLGLIKNKNERSALLRQRKMYATFIQDIDNKLKAHG